MKYRIKIFIALPLRYRVVIIIIIIIMKYKDWLATRQFLWMQLEIHVLTFSSSSKFSLQQGVRIFVNLGVKLSLTNFCKITLQGCQVKDAIVRASFLSLLPFNMVYVRMNPGVVRGVAIVDLKWRGLLVGAC